MSNTYCNYENWGVLSIIHLKLNQSELEMGNELGTLNITLILVGHSREAHVHDMSLALQAELGPL